MGMPGTLPYNTVAMVQALPDDGNRHEAVHMVLPFGVQDHGPEELARAMLLIEVLGPSTAGHHRFAKRRLYQEARVPVYWKVDSEAQSVEVWTPEAICPQVQHDAVVWHPAGADEPFTLECAGLCRPAGG